MWVAFAFAKATHIFFSKNTCELDIVLTRTVNILTTNELVKLMTLWTTEPSLSIRHCKKVQTEWQTVQILIKPLLRNSFDLGQNCLLSTSIQIFRTNGPCHAKRVFGHMRTAKAQTSLLFSNRIIGHYRMNGEQMPGRGFAHAWDETESIQFAHAWKHLFAWQG